MVRTATNTPDKEDLLRVAKRLGTPSGNMVGPAPVLEQAVDPDIRPSIKGDAKAVRPGCVIVPEAMPGASRARE